VVGEFFKSREALREFSRRILVRQNFAFCWSGKAAVYYKNAHVMIAPKCVRRSAEAGVATAAMPADVRRMALRRRARRSRFRAGGTAFEWPADTKTVEGSSSGVSPDLGVASDKRNLARRVSDKVSLTGRDGTGSRTLAGSRYCI
jgi:hypothetical protein